MRRHQQHGFLLVSTFAERDQPGVSRPPVLAANLQRAVHGVPQHHEKPVWLTWCAQRAHEEQLVCPLPYARLRTFKYPVDHSGETVGIEAAVPVEAGVPGDLRALTYFVSDLYTGRIEVGNSAKPTWVILILAEAPAPHTAKTCHRNQHCTHAPLSRPFSLRAATSCSCSSLMCWTSF